MLPRRAILGDMVVHPPRRRQYVPPPPEQLDADRAQWLAWRAEQDRRQLTWRPARLAVLRTGPALRDLDAAADCPCSCHPRPADPELHSAGTACPCQRTATQRRARLEALFDRMPPVRGDRSLEPGRDPFAEQVAVLGVAARVACAAAPVVITGTVDGRGFYMRERHERYRVTIAPDDDPAADPWERPAECLTLDIAAGDSEDLTDPDGRFDPVVALTVAVDAVRTFLHRRSCSHLGLASPGVAYCARCGIRLTEAHLWCADG